MPSIIAAPTRTRRDSRGMTEEQVQEYMDLFAEVADEELILVDESETDDYEKSYAKGERVRTAAKKFELIPEGMKIRVISFSTDDGETFQAGLKLVSA